MSEQRATVPVEEVARRLGISVPTAYRYCRQDQLPVIRLGRRVLVLREAFETLLKQGTGVRQDPSKVK